MKMRASQMNGCAYCLDMHSKDARAAGETEQRLYVLPAWREAPFYSDRERAALAWTEAVTLIHDTHVPDDFYEFARQHFSDVELVNLTMAIVAINGWNRLEVSFRGVAGSYKSVEHRSQNDGGRPPPTSVPCLIELRSEHTLHVCWRRTLMPCPSGSEFAKVFDLHVSLAPHRVLPRQKSWHSQTATGRQCSTPDEFRRECAAEAWQRQFALSPLSSRCRRPR